MARIGFFLLASAFFLFIVVDCHVPETEFKQGDSASGLVDPKNVPLLKEGNVSDANLGKRTSSIDSSKVEQGKKDEVQNEGGLEEKGEKDSKKNDSSKDLDSKQNHEVEKDEKSKDNDSGMDGENEKRGSTNEGLSSKVVPKEDTKDRESGLSKPLRKEIPWLEECDASNSCVDDKNKLVACLRVPGNESPDLSLLIQNKGSGSLNVNITAPDSVRLEQTMVQLQEKEDRKVKVSVAKGSNYTVIVLTAGSGHCELDFRDMILPESSTKVEYPSMSTYSSHLTRNLAVYLFIAAVLFIGVAWACLTLRRRHDPRYQKVETELPVSSRGKVETDASDGWDNNWGDTWDDEEAPKTPSRPLANLSSKGLAPRRSNNKDGWQNSWKD